MSRSPPSPKSLHRPRSTPSTPEASPVESLASLFVRSLLVLFLVVTSLLFALAAWFSLRSYLKVDPIVGRERVWLQYGEWRTPYAFVNLPQGQYGAPGDSYDLSLELRVPSSEQNLALGNFMVSASLLNGDDQTILNGSRPAIVTYPTSSRLSLSLLPLRSVSPPPSQTLHLPLLESVALNRNSWSSRKIERIYLEVGRKDSHASGPPGEAFNQNQGLVMGSGSSGGGAARQVVMRGGGGGELQVYESWLKIEVKLYGLRALIRSHPYLSFLFFFPTFLVTELVAALAVYAYFVFRPDVHARALQQDEGGSLDSDNVVESVVEEEQEDKIKQEDREEEVEEETTSEPPSGAGETETDQEEEAEETGEEQWKAERRRQRLERESGPGGKGMTEVSESETETELETEEEEEEETGSEEWEGVGPEVEVGREKEFDDSETIGGSETTRATRSTFGPSVAGTSSSTRTTATSDRRSEAGLRERQTRGGEVE